jgi:hypothetical protein
MTLCMMTFSITTLSTNGLFATLGTNGTQQKHSAIKLIYAECRVMLILSVTMLNDVILSVVGPGSRGIVPKILKFNSNFAPYMAGRWKETIDI